MVAKRKPNAKRIDSFNEFILENPIPVEPDKKKFSQHDLQNIKPITKTQETVYQQWADGNSLFLEGVPGSGKTMIAMYLALNDIFDPTTPYERLIIIRSAVQGRDIGALPGTQEEKLEPYTIPYKTVCDDIFKKKNQYKFMEKAGLLEFHCSSFVRGNTFNNAIILIDEAQNFTIEEAISCVSRTGKDSKVIVIGDGKYQNDLHYKKNDQSGFRELRDITRIMPSFRHAAFGIEDIVRSGICKELIISIERLAEMRAGK